MFRFERSGDLPLFRWEGLNRVIWVQRPRDFTIPDHLPVELLI